MNPPILNFYALIACVSAPQTKTPRLKTRAGGVYTNTEGNGSTLTSGTLWTYTRADGTVVTFDPTHEYRATSIVTPNGSTLNFNYASLRYCTAGTEFNGFWKCSSHSTTYHLSSLISNYGYQISIAYDFDADFDSDDPTETPYAYGWYTVDGITGLNLAAGSGASRPTQSFSDTTISGSAYHVLTDAMGRQTQYRMSGNQVVGVTLPGSTSEDETVNYTSGRVTSVVTPAGTTTYSSTDAGTVRTVIVTDPLSHVTTYKFDIPSNRMTSVTDPNNHTTSMVYDSNGRMTKLTKPEGNYTTWTYDARGNVTQVDQTAKAGSGLSDIVTTANYDSTCTYVAKCNQPNWTKDAKGNETDYTYDSTTGNLLTVTQPAATTGANRPQTRYGYTQLQAYYANSLGSIVASGLPVYRLTSISQCQTGSSCTGTSDEVKTTISYGPQTTGVGNNLLPVAVSKGDGSGALTATTAYTYDDVGNLTYVDGPLAGTADTTRTLYDADREVIGTISADPDGAGSLQNRAVRNTIDSRGLLTRTEIGTTNGQTDAAWSAFATAEQVDITYDTRRRVTSRELSAGGTPYALTQTSYNADDRVNCVATRMNTAVYGSLPSSACTQGTAGSFGPDQISQDNYDPAGQLTSVQVGVGTADAATEGTLAYTNNGKLASLTDGENNKTSYVYDGFDRLSQTQYPSPTKGAGTSNSSDYEQLAYDANSNVTSRRLRDGTSISYTFDNLSRPTLKTLPNSEPAVSYTYDLLNRVTGISQAGYAMSFGYDALSRQTAENEGFGSITRQFDLAGRLTRTTWWDGFYVTYDRLVTGELTAVRENGAASGVGVLASYAYDNLGNRTSLTFGNGATQTYAYDPVSRLQTLTNNLSGTGNSLTIGGSSTPITYNPAGQILSAPRSNDAYAFPGYYDVNRGYTSNGLNQYNAAGTASFTYDARGNLTSDGTNSYTYSSENLLKSTSGGVTLYYDPLHRLTEYDTSVSSRFVYDGANMAAEVDNPAGAIQKRYVFDDNGSPIVEYSGSGTTDRQFVSTDERGSIISLTDSSGNLIGINKYDEYGIPASGNLGRFGYTGQAWLSEIGLQYSKARIYSPTLGRFLQTDPVGYGDGPNWYAYTHNDPVNGTDPDGLLDVNYLFDDAWTCSGGGCASSPDVTKYWNSSDFGYWSSGGSSTGSPSGPSNGGPPNTGTPQPQSSGACGGYLVICGQRQSLVPGWMDSFHFASDQFYRDTTLSAGGRQNALGFTLRGRGTIGDGKKMGTGGAHYLYIQLTSILPGGTRGKFPWFRQSVRECLSLLWIPRWPIDRSDYVGLAPARIRTKNGGSACIYYLLYIWTQFWNPRRHGIRGVVEMIKFIILSTLMVIPTSCQATDKASRKCGSYIKHARAIIQKYDSDRDGQLNKTEWMAAERDFLQQASQHGVVISAADRARFSEDFNVVDKNSDGLISARELAVGEGPVSNFLRECAKRNFAD